MEDVLPKVTFDNLDRDYLADRKLAEEKKALGACAIPRKPATDQPN